MLNIINSFIDDSIASEYFSKSSELGSSKASFNLTDSSSKSEENCCNKSNSSGDSEALYIK